MRVSALRFEMPPPEPDLINVQEVDESYPVADQPTGPVESTGGGVASVPVCARPPAFPGLW